MKLNLQTNINKFYFFKKKKMNDFNKPNPSFAESSLLVPPPPTYEFQAVASYPQNGNAERAIFFSQPRLIKSPQHLSI